MKTGRTFLLILMLVSIACACRKEEGNKLSYYVTPYPYEIVSVEEPPATNEVRNVICMRGEGRGP